MAINYPIPTFWGLSKVFKLWQIHLVLICHIRSRIADYFDWLSFNVTGPRPLKQFTPPPEGEEYSDEDEYSDEEYSDEEEDDDEEDEEEDEEGLERKVPKYKDEILEMVRTCKFFLLSFFLWGFQY